MVNEARLRLALDALRSDRFEQGYGALSFIDPTDGKVKYCCLGVMCEVAIENGLELAKKHCDDVESTNFVYGTWEDGGFLPIEVRNWYELDSTNPRVGGQRATYLNDDMHMPFARIADEFEKTYLPNEENNLEDEDEDAETESE